MSVLTYDDKALVKAAFEAQKAAYVPYSHFRVGAAVLDEQGRMFSGCNIENASYGATCCAERVAVFKAVSAGAAKICRMALITDADEYARPCGICRQVLAEFVSQDFKLLAARPDGDYVTQSFEELLPGAFGDASLRSNTAIHSEEY